MLEKCPGPGDSAIYTFSRSKCDAQAATQCTASDRLSYETVIACQRDISACVSDAGRAEAQAAVQNCTIDAGSVSTPCSNAINP